jgi:hypothetical protein
VSHLRSRAASVVAVLLLLGVVACAGAPPGAAPTTGSSPAGPGRSGHGTLPPPGSFVTSIVRAGLVEPVVVPGEPIRSNDDPRAPATGNLTVFPLTVAFPEDWRSRPLVICGWTAVDGFYECKSMPIFRETGVASLGVPGRQPDDTYELWILSSDTSRGLRRLLTLVVAQVQWPLAMHLAHGFEHVNDVLTKQPPDGRSYLVGD